MHEISVTIHNTMQNASKPSEVGLFIFASSFVEYSLTTAGAMQALALMMHITISETVLARPPTAVVQRGLK